MLNPYVCIFSFRLSFRHMEKIYSSKLQVILYSADSNTSVKTTTAITLMILQNNALISGVKKKKSKSQNNRHLEGHSDFPPLAIPQAIKCHYNNVLHLCLSSFLFLCLAVHLEINLDQISAFRRSTEKHSVG